MNRNMACHPPNPTYTRFIFWTFISKSIAVKQFVHHLVRQNIQYEKLIVSPSPLNSFLWHGIAKVSNGYHIGTYSLFDKRKYIEFELVKSENDALDKIRHNRLVQYYLDYTQGFPLVRRESNGLIKIYAIKYGPVNYFGKPEFIFPLCVNEKRLNENEVYIDKSSPIKGPFKSFKELIKRIKGI